MCRSRRELSNAYFLAKIGADTAENERNFAKILTKIGNCPTGSDDPRLRDGPRDVRADGGRAMSSETG